MRGFARLLRRYRDIFVPGPDVGTNDADMKTVAIEIGLDNAVSKPDEMGGVRGDQTGAAAGGLVIALHALLKEMPRLKVLPQFADLHIPMADELTVLVQGFGAVGAHTAYLMCERMPGVRVVGISDALGYLYNANGLPVEELFGMWEEHSLMTRAYFNEVLVSDRWGVSHTKFSSASNDLLRETAFCMIPASPVANYLDLDPASLPSVTVDKMGDWAVIIEGANTYSADRSRKAARARMEREVYRQRGVLIARDFLVNSGAVIYAAQERLIKTPNDLRIPDEMLGDRPRVEKWLEEHAQELSELAEKRRKAAEQTRDDVIRRNMHELIDLLVSDADTLPFEAAEKISIHRIAERESDRTAAEIMVPMPTILATTPVREAANRLVETSSRILAVVSAAGDMVGVVTDWDITRSVAQGSESGSSIETIMSRDVIAANPVDPILEIISKLEHYEISAMPVVDEGGVVKGMVSAELLARRSLPRLLRSQID